MSHPPKPWGDQISKNAIKLEQMKIIAGSFRGSLFIELGCPGDLGKEWREDLGTFSIWNGVMGKQPIRFCYGIRANLRQTSGKPQANLGQTLGKPQAKPQAKTWGHTSG